MGGIGGGGRVRVWQRRGADVSRRRACTGLATELIRSSPIKRAFLCSRFLLSSTDVSNHKLQKSQMSEEELDHSKDE